MDMRFCSVTGVDMARTNLQCARNVCTNCLTDRRIQRVACAAHVVSIGLGKVNANTTRTLESTWQDVT